MVDLSELFAFCDLHSSRWFLWGVSIERPMYFDRQGFPIPGDDEMPPVLKWAELGEDLDYRRVAYDDLPDGSYLSTVWLGLDHGWCGLPRLFETMRFCDDKDVDWIEGPDGTRRMTTGHEPHDFPDPVTGELVEQLRYTTEEEALAMHHEIVRRLRLTLGH
jgi:hypothetical protein